MKSDMQAMRVVSFYGVGAGNLKIEESESEVLYTNSTALVRGTRFCSGS
jgi:hypothetical protein